MLAALVAAISLHGGGAGGQPGRAPAGELHLRWIAPSGCPSQEQAAALLRRHLRDALAGGAHIEARVLVARQASGYRMVVALPRGSRVLDAAVCGELVEAAALVVEMALAAGQSATGIGSPASAAPVAGTDPDTAGGWQPTVRLASQLDSGVTSGAGAGLAWRGHRQRAELAVLHWQTRTHIAAPDPPRGVRIALTTLLGQGCWEAARWLGSVCAGLEAGRLRGTGHELQFTGSASTLWLAGLVGLSRTLALGPVHLLWNADLLLPLRSPVFVVDGLGTAYQPPPALARLSLAIGLVFR